MDQDWWQVTGLGSTEIPELVVVEGSWWRREREAQRLSALEGVRELAPDWWWGRWHGRPIVYACVYGAARTVEPVHVLGQLGAPVVAQIGSCGGLQPGIRVGDVVLPERVHVEEGASRYYMGDGKAEASSDLLNAAASETEARGYSLHRGATVTTEVLLRQPRDLIHRWSSRGDLGVDMETSATFSAAAWAGMRRFAVLHVWDELLLGRSWSDALPDSDLVRRLDAEAALFEIVLRTCLGPV